MSTNYFSKWNLKNVTRLASTFTSDVYRATQNQTPVVLKVFTDKGKKSEAHGSAVLRCFDGQGAVQLLDADDGAQLLEYVDGPLLSTEVDDSRATEIICDVVEQLHSYPGPIPTELISMKQNFRRLFDVAANGDPLLLAGATLARRLVATARDVRVLHGDLHHENILKSSMRGWLAIDPKCLVGERIYDLANVFYNPRGVPTSTEMIRRRRDMFAARLNLDAERILEFAFAYGCLSACWSLEDGQPFDETLKIAKQISALLKP